MPRPGPGEVPPHLRRLHAAMQLTASVQPIGNTNVVALERDGHLEAQEALKTELTGRLRLASYPVVLWMPLAQYEREKPAGDAFIAQFVVATDYLRMIYVKSIEPEKKRMGAGAKKFLVETGEGLMLLADETYIILM